jgi:hypothetical protein
MTDHAETLELNAEVFVTWDEIVELILKHKGIHEGFYEPNVNFDVGSLSNVQAPNIAFVINRLGLKRVEEAEGKTIDASKINPAKKPRIVKPKI